MPEVLQAFLSKVEQAAEFSAASMAVLIKEVQKETGYKGKQLFMPIRVALTGQMHGRDLNQTIYLLGKDRVLDRLKSQIRGA
ncbi:Glutamate--tRNA ligase [compost metagenome]